jgi:hypothetical protein
VRSPAVRGLFAFEIAVSGSSGSAAPPGWKVSVRAAQLIGGALAERQANRAKVSELYRIRNQVTHGGRVKGPKKTQEDALKESPGIYRSLVRSFLRLGREPDWDALELEPVFRDDARDTNGVDCLICTKPITQIAAFRSNVEHAIADIISPPISGIAFHEIPCSPTEGAGYLAISVPCSERRPHMSRNNREPGFFFRSGHTSILMEVFQIRDQILRRAVPRPELDWDMRVRHDEISRANAKRITIPVSLDLILRNDSAVSARFPYLITRVDRARYLGMGPKYQEFSKNGPPIARVGPIEMRLISAAPGSMSRDIEFAGGADCWHPPRNSVKDCVGRTRIAGCSSFRNLGLVSAR